MLNQRFEETLKESPLIAILRGIQPNEVESVAEVLLEEGVKLIEVPLNSPEPLKSIERLAKIVEGRGLCGGGTITTPQEATDVANAGGQLIVSPNCNPLVIGKTLTMGLISLPGCLTPTEAFTAIEAGTTYLKLFPVGDMGPSYLASIRAPMPKHITTLAVGGIDENNMEQYWNAGARGFGLGSNIYQAGDSVEQVRQKAKILQNSANSLKND